MAKKDKKPTTHKTVAKNNKPISKKPSQKTPDSWDIVDKNKDKFLVFYKQEKTLAEIQITPETMNDLMVELNNHLIVDKNIADSWTFRKPIEPGMPEFLTIMSDGKILGTLPIEEATGVKLAKQLEKYSQKLTIGQKLNKFRKNKPKSFYLISFFATIVIGVFMYSIIVKILYNFGITLPTL